MITNRSGLADVFGVSLHTIDTRIRRGMPYKQKADSSKGLEWEFDTAECINWMIDRAKAEAEPSQIPAKDLQKELITRKLTAETEIAELELLKKKEQVVFISDAIAATANAVTVLRQRFLTLPRRIAPLVLGETDEEIAKELIEREVIDVLEELANNVDLTTNDLSEGFDEGDPPTD